VPGLLPIIRLHDSEDGSELIFPTNPADVRTSAGTETRSITLDEYGTLSRPLGRPPTTYAWSGTFYGLDRAGMGLPGIPIALWRPPADLRWQLEDWHDRQPRRPPLQPLELTVAGPHIPTILKPVYITRLDFGWAGGFGDLTYALELTEWRAALVGIDDGTETEDALAAPEAIEGEDLTEPPLPAQYGVQDGDSLWGIAQHLLGDGSRWEEIWAIEGNQETIGPDPDLIQHGQVLLLPGGTTEGDERELGDLLLVDLVEAASNA
jgi:LysM domain